MQAATVATRFPNYMQMRSHVPMWGWQVARVAAVGCALAEVVLLFVRPRTGLIAWWLWILPVLPPLWLLLPGLWRNLCPMASLNQVPRLFGFTRGRSLPRVLRKYGYLVQVVFYFAAVSTRVPLFDHSGPALAVLMSLALLAAFVGGVLFKGKSGWCGSLCPLMPIQKLYGQTPAVVVPNTHCQPCVGCQKNCYDFNPRVALLADLNEPDPDWVTYRKVFAGMLPGFVIAFYVVSPDTVASPAHLHIGLGLFYLEVAAIMLTSLGVYFLLDNFLARWTSTLFVMALFGAVALNAHNAFRFPDAFSWRKPSWLDAIEFTAVFAITVVFLVRTWRQERLIEEEASAGDPGMVVRPAASIEQAVRAAGEGHEVAFDGEDHRVVVQPGTTLLEVAERAELPIEAGCRMGVCGADPIAVTAGAVCLSAMTDQERATLERLGLDGGSVRLACCARVQGDVGVSLDVDRAPATPRVRQPSVIFDRSVQHVVVIGNGIAGMTAADHVRRHHPECTIEVVAEESHPLYNRMGLTRLIYGRSGMQGLALLPDDWDRKNEVTLSLNTQAVEIDRDQRVVTLATGERLPYDRLILATGASATMPVLPGIDRAGVFGLRTADDALSMRAFAQRHQCRRAVVLGGGLLGLEAAYGLHKLGLSTTVVQRGARLLNKQVDEHASELLMRYFDALGIEVVSGAHAIRLLGTERARALELDDGTELPLDLAVVCAGITPNVRLAEAAGLTVAGGVVVDERMMSDDERIFAAGDAAEFEGLITGLWPTAVEQAEIAATNAVGGPQRTYRPPPPVAILKGVGLDVISVGQVNEAPGDLCIAPESDRSEVSYRKLVVRGGRAVGGIVIGHPSEAASLTVAVRDGLPVGDLLDERRGHTVMLDNVLATVGDR